MSQQGQVAEGSDSVFTCCSSHLIQQTTAYSWCYHFQCATCAKSKFWCLLCNGRKYLSTLKAAEIHFGRLHAGEKANNMDSQRSTGRSGLNLPTLKEADRYFHLHDSETKEVDRYFHLYDSETNRQFYEHDECGNGLNYLVNHAAHSSPNPSPCLHPDEIRYHLLLAKLCTSISRSKRETLGMILELTYNFASGGIDMSGDYMPPRIPTSDNDLRNMYIDGKHAITTNVPRPIVKELSQVDRHAYVSLFDILADVVGNCSSLVERLKLGNILKECEPCPRNVRSVMDTRRYRRIVDRATKRCQTENPIVFWATMWSDDHEPNSLLQNRGSVHLQTVTIACDPSSNDPILNDPRSRTYPISISAKSADHEEADHRFAMELRQLAREHKECRHTYVWNPRRQGYDEVYLEILVTLQDQPERRSANYLLGGNSQFHTRWSWSCDVAQIAKNLPACDKCLENLLQGAHYTSLRNDTSLCNDCGSCLCFSFQRDGSPLLAYPPPPGYPPNADQDRFGMLHPFRLTYEKLKKAVDLSRNQIESGQWTIKEANSYLKTYCLQDKAIDRMLNNSSHRYRLIQASGETESQLEEDVAILRDIVDRFPDLLENKPYPGNWCSPVMLEQRIDVIMHLLFLGVTKSTVFMIRDWTKIKEKGTAFTGYVRSTLQETPSIPWCATAAYTGEKLGGWISENYMALARLSKWFYSRLKHVVTDSEYVEPSLPVNKWKTADCQQWFKRRGIKLTHVVDEKNISLPRDVIQSLELLKQKKKPLTRAGVAVMRKVISCYLTSVPENATLSLVRASLPTSEMIVKLVCSLHSMTAAIMAPSTSDDHVEDTDRLIKIFLSIYSRIEESIRTAEGCDTKKQKADWVRHYNFTSLLNLPDIIREFGPLRNLWEGGECGEKFIRRSKDAISNGLRGNWEIVTARKILVDQTIRNMWRRYEMQIACDNSETKILATYRLEGKIYKSTSLIYDSFRNMQPISVFLHRTQLDQLTSVAALAYDDSSDFGVELVAFVRARFDVNDGCHSYFHWAVGESDFWPTKEDRTGQKRLPTTNILGGLLLPRSVNEVLCDCAQIDKSIQSYTLITSDWREIDANGTIEHVLSVPFQSFP